MTLKQMDNGISLKSPDLTAYYRT